MTHKCSVTCECTCVCVYLLLTFASIRQAFCVWAIIYLLAREGHSLRHFCGGALCGRCKNFMQKVSCLLKRPAGGQQTHCFAPKTIPKLHVWIFFVASYCGALHILHFFLALSSNFFSSILLILMGFFKLKCRKGYICTSELLALTSLLVGALLGSRQIGACMHLCVCVCT